MNMTDCRTHKNWILIFFLRNTSEGTILGDIYPHMEEWIEKKIYYYDILSHITFI